MRPFEFRVLASSQRQIECPAIHPVDADIRHFEMDLVVFQKRLDRVDGCRGHAIPIDYFRVSCRCKGKVSLEAAKLALQPCKGDAGVVFYKLQDFIAHGSGGYKLRMRSTS